jgi:hypothetical protein
MEEQSVITALRRFHRGDGRVRAGCGNRKPMWRGRDEIAVAGPDAQFARQLAEQPRRVALLTHFHHRVTKLAMRRTRHGAAQHVRHQLHAVTNAERRNAKLEHARVALGRIVFGHALRTARQDEPHRFARAQGFNRRVVRQDLAVDRQLAQAARNELRELRAEVEHENRLMLLHEVCRDFRVRTLL